jgi:exopolysaccharide biosynthesis protein/glycosyltransferase involved in cell wall biosynthesis
MVLENIAVLIPALNPNHRLVDLVKELNQIGLAHVVVIDDGSESSSQAVFDEVQTCQAKVYHHKNNRGKGAALKTGIEYIKRSQPHTIGVVTADADGQHAPNDILRVGEALAVDNDIVLGTRDLSHPHVPFASKIGNLFSAVYYKLKTGRLIRDTQTGLRGIPARHFDFALSVEGDRYDYEMRFLEQMNEKNIAYRTVDIETIYGEDRVTHFRAVSDSYVIYRPFVRNIASSLLSAIVDITSFMLLVHVGNSVFPATAIARVISGIFNFSLNKIWVFEKRNSHNTITESLKYLALFIMQMISSGLLTEALSDVVNFHSSLLLSKILVDSFLFVANFIVQRFWIFPSHKTKYSKMRNKHAFAIAYTTILTAVTVWTLLDTFVIADKIAAVDETLANTSIYADLENEYSSSSNSGNTLDESSSTSNSDSTVDEYSPSSNSESDLDESSSSSNSDGALDGDSDSNSEAPVITDYSYQDSNIQVTIGTIREYNTDIYIADVVVSDVAYLKTALAENTYGRNIKETTSDMADEHDAILAINGDYYGFRNAGFVIRNGVLYQTTARSGTSEALVINPDGSFEIIDEGSSDAQALYDEGALQVFTFGPGLIEDGEISVTSRAEVSQSMSSNPRTAIGMIDELHYIFVVSDGRTSQSAGLSLLELAKVMQEYGCTVAYNLDGGGSSTMVFNGEVINNPTDGRSYGERKVSDIIYVGAYL